ncbi:ABC transporter G family member 1-like [Prosopis cineraria]|uniref:ABC transporter G family member 1-like n=1 Tax=Prosopis cineraria TaxID=364024 RepID=UPI0024107089|nr:ABC transporter G family member 1-like [Prosopis cineraria]
MNLFVYDNLAPLYISKLNGQGPLNFSWVCPRLSLKEIFDALIHGGHHLHIQLRLHWRSQKLIFHSRPSLLDSRVNHAPSPSHDCVSVVPLDTYLSIKAKPKNHDNESSSKGQRSVSVTWQDLCVTVPSGKNKKPILKSLTGYAKPGQLLAIMGPSGSGKTTLLDALAGRLGSNTKQTGKILINGHKEALAYGTSAYVTQDDAMLSTLTAGEALYYSCQLQLPDSMSMEEKKERADSTLREMGLQDAIHTRIGGWTSKGLSSGQKRRLSICIEIITHPKLLFLDEPTSGLDSAASYYVMSRIARLIKLRDGIQRTIVVAIHQPSSEVFQFFHNLCLLSSGETVYFGPALDTNEFFASNGFPCPSLNNPSDHFLRIINKDFDQDAEEGFGKGVTTEEAINILIKSYMSSTIQKQIQKEMEEVIDSDSNAIEKKRIHAGFLTQCLILIRRSSLHMLRNISNYWLRLAVYTALSLSLGTIFYNIGLSNGAIQARGSLLTFFISILSFITLIGGLPPLLEEMKVFKRERLNGHYGVTAFLIGNTLSTIPYMLLMSLIPALIIYYLSNLHKGLGRFVYLVSVLFAIVMSIESCMLVIGSIFPNFIMGMIIVGGIQGIMILIGGFYRLPHDLPKLVWRYPLHYVSFHKYAFQGLFKNEFDGLTFVVDDQDRSRSMIVSGREILRNTWQVEMGHSKWLDLAIMFGMIVLYHILFLIINKSKEKAHRQVAS